jgi:hypothetical protein
MFTQCDKVATPGYFSTLADSLRVAAESVSLYVSNAYHRTTPLYAYLPKVLRIDTPIQPALQEVIDVIDDADHRPEPFPIQRVADLDIHISDHPTQVLACTSLLNRSQQYKLTKALQAMDYDRKLLQYTKMLPDLTSISFYGSDPFETKISRLLLDTGFLPRHIVSMPRDGWCHLHALHIQLHLNCPHSVACVNQDPNYSIHTILPCLRSKTIPVAHQMVYRNALAKGKNNASKHVISLMLDAIEWDPYRLTSSSRYGSRFYISENHVYYTFTSVNRYVTAIEYYPTQARLLQMPLQKLHVKDWVGSGPTLATRQVLYTKKEWYYIGNDEVQHGPYTSAQMWSWAESDQIPLTLAISHHPSAPFVSISEREESLTEHEHDCETCYTKYIHHHAYSRLNHNQFPHQCPNPECADRYQTGDENQKLNLTRSQIVPIPAREEEKEATPDQPLLTVEDVQLSQFMPEANSTIVTPSIAAPDSQPSLVTSQIQDVLLTNNISHLLTPQEDQELQRTLATELDIPDIYKPFATAKVPKLNFDPNIFLTKDAVAFQQSLADYVTLDLTDKDMVYLTVPTKGDHCIILTVALYLLYHTPKHQVLQNSALLSLIRIKTADGLKMYHIDHNKVVLQPSTYDSRAYDLVLQSVAQGLRASFNMPKTSALSIHDLHELTSMYNIPISTRGSARKKQGLYLYTTGNSMFHASAVLPYKASMDSPTALPTQHCALAAIQAAGLPMTLNTYTFVSAAIRIATQSKDVMNSTAELLMLSSVADYTGQVIHIFSMNQGHRKFVSGTAGQNLRPGIVYQHENNHWTYVAETKPVTPQIAKSLISTPQPTHKPQTIKEDITSYTKDNSTKHYTRRHDQPRQVSGKAADPHNPEHGPCHYYYVNADGAVNICTDLKVGSRIQMSLAEDYLTSISTDKNHPSWTEVNSESDHYGLRTATDALTAEAIKHILRRDTKKLVEFAAKSNKTQRMLKLSNYHGHYTPHRPKITLYDYDAVKANPIVFATEDSQKLLTHDYILEDAMILTDVYYYVQEEVQAIMSKASKDQVIYLIFNEVRDQPGTYFYHDDEGFCTVAAQESGRNKIINKPRGNEKAYVHDCILLPYGQDYHPIGDVIYRRIKSINIGDGLNQVLYEVRNASEFPNTIESSNSGLIPVVTIHSHDLQTKIAARINGSQGSSYRLENIPKPVLSKLREYMYTTRKNRDLCISDRYSAAIEGCAYAGIVLKADMQIDEDIANYMYSYATTLYNKTNAAAPKSLYYMITDPLKDFLAETIAQEFRNLYNSYNLKGKDSLMHYAAPGSIIALVHAITWLSATIYVSILGASGPILHFLNTYYASFLTSNNPVKWVLGVTRSAIWILVYKFRGIISSNEDFLEEFYKFVILPVNHTKYLSYKKYYCYPMRLVRIILHDTKLPQEYPFIDEKAKPAFGGKLSDIVEQCKPVITTFCLVTSIIAIVIGIESTVHAYSLIRLMVTTIISLTQIYRAITICSSTGDCSQDPFLVGPFIYYVFRFILWNIFRYFLYYRVIYSTAKLIEYNLQTEYQFGGCLYKPIAPIHQISAALKSNQSSFTTMSKKKVDELRNNDFKKSSSLTKLTLHKHSNFKALVEEAETLPFKQDDLTYATPISSMYYNLLPKIPAVFPLAALWALIIRQCTPLVLPDPDSIISLRKYISINPDTFEQAIHIVTLKSQAEYLEHIEKSKRLSYARGFEKYEKQPRMKKTYRLLPKSLEKQHNSTGMAFDDVDIINDKHKNRMTTNPNEVWKAVGSHVMHNMVLVLKEDHKLRALRSKFNNHRIRKQFGSFVQGMSMGEVALMIQKVTATFINPLFVSRDNSNHDGHQNYLIKTLIDDVITLQVDKLLYHIGYATLEAVKGIIMMLNDHTYIFTYAYSKAYTRGVKLGRHANVLTAQVAYTQPSGDGNTTAMNTERCLCINEAIAEEAGFLDEYHCFQAGDDSLEIIEAYLYPAYLRAFGKYYYIGDPGKTQPKHGIGMLCKEVYTSSTTFKFCSKIGHYHNGLVVMYRDILRLITTGCMSTKISKRLPINLFNHVITEQIRSQGADFPVIEELIKLRTEELDHLNTTKAKHLSAIINNKWASFSHENHLHFYSKFLAFLGDDAKIFLATHSIKTTLISKS